MFFARLARIVAVLLLLVAAADLFMGFGIASGARRPCGCTRRSRRPGR